MKISIWQQFSSNHSAHFTTIGQFETEEWAITVADELRQMITKIGEWWQEQPEYSQAMRRLRRDHVYLTPPELDIKSEYDVDWCIQGKHPKPIDWIGSPDRVDCVHQFGNLVMVSPTGNTWCGAHPFDNIMKKLGGQVTSAVEDGSYLTVHISFSAPSDEIRDQLLGQLRVLKRKPCDLIAIPGFGNAVPGDLTVNDNQFQIERLYLAWAGLRGNEFDNFLIVFRYLESNGCTDIVYRFEQQNLDDYNES